MSCIQLLELNPSCNSSEKENQISVIWSDDQNWQNEPKKSQRSLQHQVDYSPINPIIDTNVSKKETTIKANIELLQDAGQPEPLVTTSLGRTVKQPSHLIDFVTYLKIQTWEKNKCQKVDLKGYVRHIIILKTEPMELQYSIEWKIFEFNLLYRIVYFLIGGKMWSCLATRSKFDQRP